MLTFDDALRLDALALEQIGADVSGLSGPEWALPTPCAGWTVRDLVEHMTDEHLALCGGGRPGGDPADAFVEVAGRWLDLFAATGPALVHVPSIGSDQPAATVLAVHLADMVVHRWDLAAAVGRGLDVPEELLATAHAVAAFATDPSSPLVGEGRAYRPALPGVPGEPSLSALLRRYGRDPSWGAHHP